MRKLRLVRPLYLPRQRQSVGQQLISAPDSRHDFRYLSRDSLFSIFKPILISCSLHSVVSKPSNEISHHGFPDPPAVIAIAYDRRL
jgi:hypothetical protein